MHPEDDDPRHPRRGGERGASRPDYGQAGHVPGSRGPGPADQARRDAQQGPRAANAATRARKTAEAGRKVASLSGRAAGGAARVARKTSRSGGAGETGLYRLLELHAVNAAADSALAISLAGTLFFAVPSGEARYQIALFLGITMLPFAVIAPLIGPFLDRYRRGRRWAIGGTMAVRAFGAWAMAGAVVNESAWLFPAALTCLIASKAYGVTRASAVPRLLPEGQTLVRANSRISLAGTAGGMISAPLAGLAALLGPDWSLRYAALLYAGATALAILLPARVDSSEGEAQVGVLEFADPGRGSRRNGLTPMVILGLRCNAGLRILSGFLTMFMAFLLREHPFHGWEDKRTLLLGLVIGSAALGSTVGTLIGSVLKARKPEVIVLFALLLDAAVATYAAVFYSLVAAVIFGLMTGLAQGLGKLALDAIIQREVPELVRTSVFARSETLLQLSWVIGGFLGVFMPLNATLGLSVVAVVLVAWTIFVVQSRLASGRRQRSLPSLRPPYRSS